MKIAILGTRGIPNNYGGFEQFAEYISVGLVNKGHQVTVYNPHFHPYERSNYKGVEIRKIYSPEKIIGASANYFYDLLCLLDARKQNFDIVYEAGYPSVSIYYPFFKEHFKIVTNMDGLEWKRAKWNFLTKNLMKFAERMAVKHSDYLISDNKGIYDFYLSKYNVKSTILEYGADLVSDFDPLILDKYNLKADSYSILIARVEPENNIEEIILGYIKNQNNRHNLLLVIGNHSNKHGKYLFRKYGKNSKVRFIGSIYDKRHLDSLRHFSQYYFHGHSVGGTNPSLLEAMAAGCFIIANDNEFNKSVLSSNAFYFKNYKDIKVILENNELLLFKDEFLANNINSIETKFSWENIVEQHLDFFKRINNNISIT